MTVGMGFGVLWHPGGMRRTWAQRGESLRSCIGSRKKAAARGGTEFRKVKVFTTAVRVENKRGELKTFIDFSRRCHQKSPVGNARLFCNSVDTHEQAGRGTKEDSLARALESDLKENVIISLHLAAISAAAAAGGLARDPSRVAIKTTFYLSLAHSCLFDCCGGGGW